MPHQVTSHGPGPFLTHRIQPRPDGRYLVASSRRHRKGLTPHVVDRKEDASAPCPRHWIAFGHLAAPRRLTVNYLGGDMPTFTLNFSRPGNQVIAQYYNFLRLGRDGYTRIQSQRIRPDLEKYRPSGQ